MSSIFKPKILSSGSLNEAHNQRLYALSQFTGGDCLILGQFMTRDLKKALEFIEKSARSASHVTVSWETGSISLIYKDDLQTYSTIQLFDQEKTGGKLPTISKTDTLPL